jgi:hypothetical protein
MTMIQEWHTSQRTNMNRRAEDARTLFVRHCLPLSLRKWVVALAFRDAYGQQPPDPICFKRVIEGMR